MNRLFFTVLLAGILILAACGAEPTPTPGTFESPPNFESPLNLPNPASQHCVDQGYQLEMRTEAGGTTGYCLFPDGTECEEWAFYRNECGPGTPKP